MKGSYKNSENQEYLRTELSLPRVTTLASVACKDISLDKASEVLLWKEAPDIILFIHAAIGMSQKSVNLIMS